MWGGVRQGQRIPQAISIGYKSKIKMIDVAHTIIARDYKGMGNQAMNAVMYENKSEECN